MITGFDHVVIAVRDIDIAVDSYEKLLGRSVIARELGDGVATAVIALDNIAVELMAPEGEGETGQRLSAALEDGEGLKSLVLATPDIEGLHRRCARVGLDPQPIAWADGRRSFRAGADFTHGVRLFFMQRETPLPPSPASEAHVLGLDHVVVQSADTERAAALYGARLGLDMRLDREVRGRRLMFFRCGDAIVEIAHVEGREHDLLWGLSWRVADAHAARERLAAAGVNVSDVRAGMKPDTSVFTVRDGACGVPTLMIQQGNSTP